MSKRLNQERQLKLEPKRYKTAVDTLTKLGKTVTVDSVQMLSFDHKECRVVFYPYSGWFSGKTVKDGRGLKNLIKQIEEKK